MQVLYKLGNLGGDGSPSSSSLCNCKSLSGIPLSLSAVLASQKQPTWYWTLSFAVTVFVSKYITQSLTTRKCHKNCISFHLSPFLGLRLKGLLLSIWKRDPLGGSVTNQPTDWRWCSVDLSHVFDGSCLMWQISALAQTGCKLLAVSMVQSDFCKILLLSGYWIPDCFHQDIWRLIRPHPKVSYYHQIHRLLS